MTTLAGTVVQKYGGSSLATCELIRGVAGKVTRVHGSGRPVVVVVSARGDTTDVLPAMAAQIGGPRARGREVDQPLAPRSVLELAGDLHERAQHDQARSTGRS